MRLVWGQGPPMFDLGVSQGVLYLDNGAVPWNGLVSVEDKETGSVDTEHYFDGKRIHISQELGDYEATVSAYTYPEIFAEYNGFGPQEEYRRFGFSYRTEFGDTYAIHLVYNVLVRDDSRIWETANEGASPSLFNWDVHSSAVDVPGSLPSGHLIVEAPRDPAVFAEIEDILYGTDATDPRLPDPAEIVELYEAATVMRVTYLGGGRYQVTGPDDMVQVNADGSFVLNAPTVQTKGDSFVVGSF